MFTTIKAHWRPRWWFVVWSMRSARWPVRELVAVTSGFAEPRRYSQMPSLGVGSPSVGTPLQTVCGWVCQVPLARSASTTYCHLYTACACCRSGTPPTVWPVSQTPIYDQFRGERINAEVPTTESDLQRGRSLWARPPAGRATWVERWCSARPTPGPDLAAKRHHPGYADSAHQLAGDGQWAVSILDLMGCADSGPACMTGN